MQCPNCGLVINDSSNRYCSRCGSILINLGPFFGTYMGSQLETFSCVFIADKMNDPTYRNAIITLVQHFKKLGISISLFRRPKSDIPINEYPYICGNCKIYVVNKAQGKCGHCGADKWVNRGNGGYDHQVFRLTNVKNRPTCFKETLELIPENSKKNQ